MENKLTEMLRRRLSDRPDHLSDAAKEVMQEVILAALSTTDFFSQAAFYGGTSLRIFHGLRRFSEDLDFSLLRSNPDFHWNPYFDAITRTFENYGARVEAIEREKISATDTRSAFLKENAIETMRLMLPSDFSMPQLNPDALIKIKFEIDVRPPENASYQWATLSDPFHSDVRVFDLPSLFAGKLSAVLMRGWKNRVKGRDYYDYMLYVGKRSKINFAYVQSNLEKAGYHFDKPLDLPELKKMLLERFQKVDFESAKADVVDFLDNPDDVKHWDYDYFASTLDYLVG